MDRKTVIEAVIRQLDNERLLGGRWLPFPMPSASAATGKPEAPPAAATDGSMTIPGSRSTAAANTHATTDSTPPSPTTGSAGTSDSATPFRPATTGQTDSVASPVPQSTETKGTPLVQDSDSLEQQRRLEDVATHIRQCRQCPLGELRTHAVPGEGHPNTRILFVGEAPGKNEDQQGRPFVGRAGKLLDNIIKAMGLTREEVFIGNIIKCRPPNNRDPQANEIDACIGYLHEQIEIMSPEIIIALGAYSARTLLDSTKPIGQLRGKVHQYHPSPLMEPIKLVATYHPAYLIRNYNRETRARVWQDMQRVMAELGMTPPKQ